MDIIKASQELSDDGAKLNALLKKIGNECVESSTKNDLFAYLERITLVCHQLNVTSKVKSDMHFFDTEVKRVITEASNSLIENSTNLFNAVLLYEFTIYIKKN